MPRGTGGQARPRTACRSGAAGRGLSPDGRMIATAGEDKTILLRNAATQCASEVARGPHRRHRGPGLQPRRPDACLGELRPDGPDLGRRHGPGRHAGGAQELGLRRRLLARRQDLASASYDKTVKLWDVASGRETATLAGHRAGVRAGVRGPRRRDARDRRLGPDRPALGRGGAAKRPSSKGTRGRSGAWPSRPTASCSPRRPRTTR